MKLRTSDTKSKPANDGDDPFADLGAFAPIARAIASFVVAEIRATPAPAENITDREVAAMSGRSPRSIRSDVRAGKLPATRSGKRLIFKRADVEAWLAARPVAVRAKPAADEVVDDEALLRAACGGAR